MKNKYLIMLFLISVVFASCRKAQQDDYDWLINAVDVAGYQLKFTAEEIADSAKFPRSIRNGERRLENLYDWTSGFYPGSLWYEYELTGDKYFESQAAKFTNLLHDLKDYKGTHDLGFMIFCSFGNAERLSPNDTIKKVLTDGAESLASRYNETTKVIR